MVDTVVNTFSAGLIASVARNVLPMGIAIAAGVFAIRLGMSCLLRAVDRRSAGGDWSEIKDLDADDRKLALEYREWWRDKHKGSRFGWGDGGGRTWGKDFSSALVGKRERARDKRMRSLFGGEVEGGEP